MKTKLLLTFGFIAFGFIALNSGSKVFAGSCTWIGGSGSDWGTAANWSAGCSGAGGIPGTNDDITIPANTSTNNNIVSLTLNSITFDGLPGGTQSGFGVTIVDSINNTGVPNPISIDFPIVLAGSNVSFSTNNYLGFVDLNGNNLIVAPTVLPWGINGQVIGTGTITANNVGDIYFTGGASGTVIINASGNTRVGLGGSGWNNSSVVNLSNGAILFGDGAGINTITGDGTAVIRPTEEDGTTTNILGIDNLLSIGPGDTLSFRIAGTTPGSQHDQIFIDNSFEVAGATLALSLAYTPSIGDTIVLIQAGDILGTFTGLPDGAVISVGGSFFQIHYSSTDITLEAVDLILQFQSFNATPSNTTYGSSVTISLQLGGNMGIPTGTVEFSSNGVSIGTVTVDGSGLASLTLSNLSVGTNSITAGYSGDSTYPAAISGGPITVTVAAALADTGINLPINLITFSLVLSLGGLVLTKRVLK